MAFVSRTILESGHPVYRVFRKHADAMQHLQIAREAFDSGREPDGEIELVTDYAVLRVATEDVRAAIDQVKKGEGFIVVHDLEKDQRQREAERSRLQEAERNRLQTERARREAEHKKMLDLL